MELNYLKKREFNLFEKKKIGPVTSADIIKLCVNIVVWLGMTLGTYGAMEFIHRGGIEPVKVFMDTHPQVMLMNFLMLLVITSPALLFKRTHFTAMILCLISGITCSVSYMILKFRGVPLIWSDLYTIGEGLSIADQYIDKELIVKVSVLLLVATIVLVIAFLIRYKVYNIHFIWRFILWGCVAGSLFFGVKTIKAQGVIEPIPWDVRLAYERNGFVYSFIDSYLATFRKAPEGYGKETIQSIQDGFVTVDANQDKPNIIMIQLEGIMDPYSLEGITYSEDALVNFRKIGMEQAMGLMQVPTMGGGTVRTEFEALTSMNIDYLSPGEIPYNSGALKKGAVESSAHVLKEEGYHTTAIHNFQGNFYSRESVFATLGFDTFIPMEAMKNLQKIAGVWPRDHVILDYIKKSMETSQEKDFIYAITVGSHGPYNEGPIVENAIEVKGNIEGSAKAELEIYLQRLKEVDKFVGNLVAYVKGLNEHTVLVMFSDHYPSMEVVNGVDNEDKFLVPYVAMDNRMSLKGKLPEQLEAYELTTYIMDLYSIEGGAMNSYQRSYRGEENYHHGLALVQYDLLFGNKYVTEGKNPYQIADLNIGLDELAIHQVKDEEDKLVIKGDGFNQSSKIYIDDQELTTQFIDGNTLMTQDAVPQNYKKVIIKQLGRNNISLLDSNVFEIKND